MALVPLLMSLLAGFTLLALVIRNHTFVNSSCRKAAFTAQAEMGQSLTQLMKLNPQAASLRKQRRYADKQVKAARSTGYAPAIAAAEAYRAFVVAQQLLLQAEQRLLLFQAQMTRQKAPMDLSSHAKRFAVSFPHGTSRTRDLAVKATPARDLSPSYETQASFRQRQALQLQFTTDLLTYRPAWLRLTGLDNQLRYTVKCAASLKQKGKKWSAILIPAKS